MSFEQAVLEKPDKDRIAELVRELTNVKVRLRRAHVKIEHLVEASMEGAHGAMVAMGPIVIPPPPKADKRKKAKAEAALWHMTDWQGSKVTTSYNTEVMHERVRRFVEKAASITEIQRKDHPVRECTIMFGGDMVEGLFNYPTQPFEIDATIFEQWAVVSRLLIETVGAALGIYEHVTVIGEWGNHGRIGSRRDVVPRSDNVDRMCYEFARTMLKNEKRLTWEDSAADVQRVEIGNYRALLMHGDEIGRGGFASPMTIVRHANQWRSGSYPWEFRDLYVGHYHTHNEWAMANGEGTVYQTGSTESDNRYARETMAASAIPSQRLHFVDPEKGRVTAQYKVFLDE